MSLSGSDGHPTDPRPTEHCLSDEEIGRLVRLAGPRPEAPETDAAIVRQAAFETWRRSLQWRRRRRLGFQVGSGLLAAALAFLALRPGLIAPPAPPEIVATVVALEGDIGDAFAVGSGVAVGEVVETGGARVALRSTNGTSLRLDRGSRARLTSPADVALERGAVYADTGACTGEASTWVRVATAHGIVRDIGTRFSVRVGDPDAPLSVAVRDGVVAWEQDGRSVRAEGGEAFALLADGTVRRAALAPYDEAWAWTRGLTEPFAVEGATLRALLDWAARERGWTVAFADPALERRARETVLYGTIAGMGIEDAVASYLKGSQLRHRLEDGVLFIEAAEP